MGDILRGSEAAACKQWYTCVERNPIASTHKMPGSREDSVDKGREGVIIIDFPRGLPLPTVSSFASSPHAFPPIILYIFQGLSFCILIVCIRPTWL